MKLTLAWKEFSSTEISKTGKTPKCTWDDIKVKEIFGREHIHKKNIENIKRRNW